MHVDDLRSILPQLGFDYGGVGPAGTWQERIGAGSSWMQQASRRPGALLGIRQSLIDSYGSCWSPAATRRAQAVSECVVFLVDRGRFRLFRACEVYGVDLTYCKTAFNTTINLKNDMIAGRAKEGSCVNLSVFEGQ